VTVLAGVASVESRVELGIISQLLQNVAFSELRTRMQLGYVVSAGVGMLSNVQYVSCIVQGSVLDPDQTEAAIENMFATNMTNRLDNMTDDDFDALKDSFKQTLLEAPLSQEDEAGHFFSPIKLGADCFALRSEMIKYVDETSKKTRLLRTWRKIMQPESSLRNRVVVKYFPGEIPARPSLQHSSAMWEKAGVGSSHAVLLASEYTNTTTHEKANSTLRAMLAGEGGYYTTEVHCTMGASKAALQTDEMIVSKEGNDDEVSEMLVTEHKGNSTSWFDRFMTPKSSKTPKSSARRKTATQYFLGAN